MPRQPPRCGTSSGYRAHYQRDEQPCEACRLAHSKALKRPYKPARYCDCGRQIKSAHDKCWRCREGRANPDAAPPQPQIEWQKNARGVFVAVRVHEPGEASWWSPRAARRSQWEQVNA